MRRPLDKYQQAKAAHHFQVEYQALLRQDEVIRHYQTKHYQIICADDPATRNIFEIPQGPALAAVGLQAVRSHLQAASARTMGSPRRTSSSQSGRCARVAKSCGGCGDR
jgi:hypothetical protein